MTAHESADVLSATSGELKMSSFVGKRESVCCVQGRVRERSEIGWTYTLADNERENGWYSHAGFLFVQSA